MNMNIQRINQASQTYRSVAQKPGTTRKAGASRDEISISPEARLLDYARKAAAALPDIREEIVAPIKKRIENGSYNVPASALCDKLLEE